MNYVIIKPKGRECKLSFEEVLLNLVDETKLQMAGHITQTTSTRTYCLSYIPKYIYDEIDIESYINMLESFYNNNKQFDISFDDNYNYKRQIEIERELKREALRVGITAEHENLLPQLQERMESEGLKMNPYYYTFYIPKKSSSKLRQIDAPCDDLMCALSNLKYIFESMMNHNTYHTAAYAYVPKRSSVDLVKKLKENKSRWILKLDFSDFFGSINIDFAMKQLKQIWPFSGICESTRGEAALYNCLKLCFLDKRLPQGTPISPLLTNIIMIPFDYQITNNFLHKANDITTFDRHDDELDTHRRLIYTRYADDLYIGSYRGFDYRKVLKYIQDLLKDTPLRLNAQKTRYGSIAGRNWILGLMYNQDQNITIGYKKKKQISAMIANAIMDIQNNISVEPNDMQVILGNIAYMHNIEAEYTNNLLSKYNEKFGCDVLQIIKSKAYIY